MTLSIQLEDLTLIRVFSCRIGGKLEKGGKRANPEIFDACGRIKNRFLCYYWRTDNDVLYVGSITKDYKKSGNNLVGRIGNYLQNHVPGMTNKNVFDAANDLLRNKPLEFGIFRFSSLNLQGKRISYDDCSENGNLTYMIENVLIGFYKEHKQCEWNR